MFFVTPGRDVRWSIVSRVTVPVKVAAAAMLGSAP